METFVVGISSPESFLDHFRAIAGNFKWMLVGGKIYAFKWGRQYDPISAYAQITKGNFIEKHKIEDAASLLRIEKTDFYTIMKIIYNPDYCDMRTLKLRKSLEEICKLNSEDEPPF